MAHRAYQAFYRWAYPSTFRRAASLICVSNSTRDAIAEGYPQFAAKTRVIQSALPAGADAAVTESLMNQVKAKYDLPEQFVLFIGSTRPNKNIPAMLGAFRRMLRQNADMRNASTTPIHFVLILTKDRFFPAISDAVSNYGLKDRVQILDPVSEDEKRALYRLARVFFFACKHEGFGLPVLEAQAQGLLVVAARDASLPEIVGDSALLISSDDEDEMAQALARAIVDEDARKRLSARGLENVKRFSWEKAAREVLGIYRQNTD